MEKTKLLQLRNAAKKKKPNFVVKETNFSARVKKKWRFPRGKHSAVRQQHRGRPVLVRTGYGSPRIVRGLHSSGMLPVLVSNLKDLKSINIAEEGAVIASTVGNRKRTDLIKFAEEKKIKILNLKDPQAVLKKIETSLVEKKKIKEEKLKDKSKKDAEKRKRAEDKKKKEEEEKKSKDESKKTVEETVAEEEKIFKESIKDDGLKKEVEKTITKRQ